MAKVTGKKLLTMAGMGCAALIVTAGLVYMATSPKGQRSSSAAVTDETAIVSSGGTNTFGDFSEPSGEVSTDVESPENAVANIEQVSQANLERLREREAELDAVYEGSDPTQYQGGDEPVVIDDVGSFSNFDRRQPVASKEADSSAAGVIMEEVVIEPKEDTIADPLSEAAEMPLAGESDAYDADAALAQSLPTERPPYDDAPINAMSLQELKEEMDTLRLQLNDQPDVVEYIEMANAIEGLQASVDTINDRFGRVEERVTEMTAGNDVDGDLDDALISLEERLNARIAEVEAAEDDAGDTAAPRPTQVNVTRLYQLESIDQGEAVLVGQNTGKTYRVSEGDGLAYGGRLAQITGDTVTLSWPNQTVTLSVFD